MDITAGAIILIAFFFIIMWWGHSAEKNDKGKRKPIVFRRQKILRVEKLMDKIDDKRFDLSNGYVISFYGSGVPDGNKKFHRKKWLRLGVGKVTSGSGDWGGGFEYAQTCPIFIFFDQDLKIHEIKFDDFYNSPDSAKEVRRKCEQYCEANNFQTLKVHEDSNLYQLIQYAFKKYVGKKDTISPLHAKTFIVGKDDKYKKVQLPKPELV